MPKFRPSSLNCLYVIPDIHGAYDLLVLILKQILPLRKSDGGKDHLFLLGDYGDRNKNTHQVIDLLIQVEAHYPGQVHKLMGNHEEMQLRSYDRCPYTKTSGINLEVQFRNWIKNGGYATIEGYIERHGLNLSSLDLPRFRVEGLIPKEHWQFLESCEKYIKHDNYLFVHGGLNPYKDVEKHEFSELVWDRSLYKTMLLGREQNDFSFVEWEPIIVSGHSGSDVLIHPKYMMLDAGAPEQLMCVELNSMEAVMAIPGNSRLVKFNAKEKYGVI